MSYQKSNRLFLLVLILLLFSCIKKPTNPDLEKYSGITVTGEGGPGPIGAVDPNDWCYSPPYTYAVFPAYPNPASVQTTIMYKIADSVHVKMKIINRYGRQIRLLVNEQKPAGYYTVRWNLTNDDGKKVIPDLYRCIFEAGNFRCYGDILVKYKK